MMLVANPPASYACFTISNVFSNKVLEVRGDTTLLSAQSSAKNIQHIPVLTPVRKQPKSEMVFNTANTGAISGSTPFKIMNVASGLFLEAPDGNSGTQLFQDHANGFPSQIWYLHQVGSTTNYYIQIVTACLLKNGSKYTEI